MDMEFRENLAYSILEVCEASGGYEATTEQAVYQLKAMAQQGLLVLKDNAERNNPSVECITEIGYRILAKYHNRISASTNAEILKEQSRKTEHDTSFMLSAPSFNFFKLVYDTMIDETRSFERVMWLILSGGVTGCWFVSKWYIEKVGLPRIGDLKWLVVGTVVWFIAMIALMASHYTSMQSHKHYITAISCGNLADGWKSGWRTTTIWLNIIAGILTIAGFGVAVTAFCFKVF